MEAISSVVVRTPTATTWLFLIHLPFLKLELLWSSLILFSFQHFHLVASILLPLFFMISLIFQVASFQIPPFPPPSLALLSMSLSTCPSHYNLLCLTFLCFFFKHLATSLLDSVLSPHSNHIYTSASFDHNSLEYLLLLSLAILQHRLSYNLPCKAVGFLFHLSMGLDGHWLQFFCLENFCF